MHQTASAPSRPAIFSGRENTSSQSAGDSLVREARDRAFAAWDYDRENREEGFVDLRFLANDQWPHQVRLEREAAGRPVITINRLAQFLFQVANDIRANPPGLRVVPASGETDAELAKIYVGLIRSIEQASNGPNIYATAGGHAVACGIGSWRVKTQYVDDDVFEQELAMEPIRHPFSVLWDPEAIQPDRSDAKWCQVTQLVHKDAFKDRYPKASAASFDVPIPGQDPEGGMFWRSGDFIRLVEYWCKIPKRKKLMRFESGLVTDATDLSRSEIEQLVLSNGQVNRERDVDSHKVQHALLSAVDVLEEPEDWLGRHIPIVSTIGGEIPLDTKVVRFGLVRFARDAQQLYNYARSAAAESIGLAPKSPYLLTTTMIARYKAMWDSHNTTQRPYLVYDADKEAPEGPRRLHPPETPQAFYQEQQIASEDMKGTTGIYDASLGARSNETSGVAINARDRQGDTATAHYSSNLITSMLHCGRILIDLIPHVYDSERIVRTLGEDEKEEMVPINHMVLSDRGEPVLINDLSQGKYDVRPRTGPSYTTRRLEAADSMLAFAQAVPGAAAIIGDLIAQNMDWPGADEIAKRLKRAIPPQILGEDADEDNPQAQQQAQQAQQAQMLQQAMAKLGIMEQEAKIEKMKADAEKSRSSAASEKIDALIQLLTAVMQGLPIDGMRQAMGGGGQFPGAPGTGIQPMMQPPAGVPGLPGEQPMRGNAMQPGAGGEDGQADLAALGLPGGGLDEFLGRDQGGEGMPL